MYHNLLIHEDYDMGMDVMGSNATSEAGEYFRASVWGWRPLASLCLNMAPEIWQRIQYPNTNDGDGLNAKWSKRLAEVLSRKVMTGEVQKYIDQYQAALDALPDETCTTCGGSGERNYADPHLDPAIVKGRTGTFPCNGCGGTGHRRPSDTFYTIDLEVVQRWILFLRDCGGFAIY